MYQPVKQYCESLAGRFHEIPPGRRLLLETISAYIHKKRAQEEPVRLVYICTHNSRRSHFGQVWASVAAAYYDLRGVSAYSGGTEATAFHPNAIAALERAGLKVRLVNGTTNPVYQVLYDDREASVECFSKVYDDPKNPKKEFAAVMTCSEAEENCPFIVGAELRIGTTYEDPKAFDGTGQQNAMYDERCRQIALETLYFFSKVRTH